MESQSDRGDSSPHSTIDAEEATAPAQAALSGGTDAAVASGVMQRLFGKSDAKRTFGRYRVRSTLGRGAMGSVFLAVDPDLDREVALKVLHAELGHDQRDLLVREAKAMARLNHRNVVAVYDVGEHNGRAFVAMERVEGETVREWLAQAPRDWRAIASVYHQAALGLAAAHEAGMVHRDFKPDNVMVAEDGRVMVTDFGLARVNEGPRNQSAISIGIGPAKVLTESEAQAATRSLVGTPAYLAPEVIVAGTVSPTSDQFAWSVSLYEALYRKRPFSGRTIQQLLLNIGSGERDERPPRGAVPGRIVALVERGLAPEPEERFGSMRELAKELERCLIPFRRRVLLPAVAVAIGASALVGGWSYRELQGSQCETEAAATEQVWGPTQRTGVREALSAPNATYAEETAGRVVARFDAWAEQWRDGRREACLGRAEDPWPGRRSDCFARALSSLKGAVEVLSTPEQGTAEKALAVATAVTDPSVCSDDTYLQAAGLLPPSEHDASRAAEIRDGLARARALNTAGKFAEARTLVRAQRDAADDAGFLPLRAEAALVMASVLDHEDKPEDAWREFQRAFTFATEAEATLVAIESALELGFLATLTGREVEGQVWATVAEGHIARLGPAGTRWAVRHQLALAALAGKSDPEAALRYVAAGKKLSAGLLARDDVTAIGLLIAEASAKQSSGDFGGAARILKDALALTERRHGEQHPAVIAAMQRLVAPLAENREYDEAGRVATRLVALSEAVYGGSSSTHAGALMTLANVYSITERLDEAEELYLEALAIQRATGGPLGPILTNLGRVADVNGQNEKALEYFAEAIEIEPTPNLAVAISLFNRATVEDELERYDAAIADLDRAMEILLEHPGRWPFLRGDVLLLRGWAEVERGHPERAVEDGRAGVLILRDHVAPREFRLIRALGSLGEFLVRAGRPQEARPVLEEAVAVHEELYPDSLDAAVAYFAMARVEDAAGSTDAALKWAEAAVRVAGTAAGTEHMSEFRDAMRKKSGRR